MYAAPFEYMRAGSWDEAVRRLADEGEEARVIAGGQSLVPLMMLRMSTPTVLVDVNGAGPRSLACDNGTLRIDALVRHVDLEASPEARTAFPALSDAARWIGNVRVRHRGTIGGSLAHADPAAELPCVALAAGAEVVALGPAGERTIPASDLFTGHYSTALEPGELITRIDVPAVGEHAGCAFAELARRTGDFALAEACAVVELDGDGACRGVRLTVGAVSDRPLDASAAVAELRGSALDDAATDAAGRAAADYVEVRPGGHSSAGYVRRMLGVVATRALRAAAARARGKETA